MRSTKRLHVATPGATPRGGCPSARRETPARKGRMVRPCTGDRAALLPRTRIGGVEHKAVTMLAAWSRPDDWRPVDDREGARSRTGYMAEPRVRWLVRAITSASRPTHDEPLSEHRRLAHGCTRAVPSPARSRGAWSGVRRTQLQRLPPPRFEAPGGAVYKTTTSRVYYPQGCGLGHRAQTAYALIDIQAAAFGFRRLREAPASNDEMLHLQPSTHAAPIHRRTHLREQPRVQLRRGVRRTSADSSADYLSMFVRDRT